MQQLNLFGEPPRTGVNLSLDMDKTTLIEWKQRIFDYQQRAKNERSHLQPTLFDIPQSHCDPDEIDPFGLKHYPLDFWKWDSWEWRDEACLYFVIDYSWPLLLYVGETKQKPRERWQNHDCWQYTRSYIYLHSTHDLRRPVNIAFFWDAPLERKARQKLESELIHKWRSPFNKENYQYWGKPFKKFL